MPATHTACRQAIGLIGKRYGMFVSHMACGSKCTGRRAFFNLKNARKPLHYGMRSLLASHMACPLRIWLVGMPYGSPPSSMACSQAVWLADLSRRGPRAFFYFKNGPKPLHYGMHAIWHAICSHVVFWQAIWHARYPSGLSAWHTALWTCAMACS